MAELCAGCGMATYIVQCGCMSSSGATGEIHYRTEGLVRTVRRHYTKEDRLHLTGTIKAAV